MGTKGKQTRQFIIDKSLQIFSVQGYFNTSVNDILKATGLTKGGLYGHFRSKEDVWYAVYDEAVRIWRGIVFEQIRTIRDPLARIEQTIANDLQNYLGADVFEGGCFFLNSLVELAGQSTSMSRHILRGFIRFAKLLRSWLEEADQQGRLKAGLDLGQSADFIVITLNGAGALYAATRDDSIWEKTLAQLKFYLRNLECDTP